MKQRRVSGAIFAVTAAMVACRGQTSNGANGPQPEVVARTAASRSSRPTAPPTLVEVGTRGFLDVQGRLAEFSANDPSVEIWKPAGRLRAPVVVYAHGGAGYREDDRARVAMFRRNGFATISFDAYAMNGFADWEFINRRVSNTGKQRMISAVFRGAVRHAVEGRAWDNRNVFLYGGSNGGRVVLSAGADLKYGSIRGIIAEAPAGSGFPLDDYNIPTIIPFGALDTWAGRSDTDFVWKRTFPESPVSIESWVLSQQTKGHPIKFLFYPQAGHLLFEGPLEKVTVRRGDTVAFTAYQGAASGVLESYERDVIGFARSHLAR